MNNLKLNCLSGICTSTPKKESDEFGPVFLKNPTEFLIYHTQDHESNTSLHKYMMNPFICEDIAQRLLKCSPSFLNAKNTFKMTPLHLGAMVNEPAKIRQLIIAGANPMIRDIYGHLPLHYASVTGNSADISPLIESFNDEEIAQMKLRRLKIPKLSQAIYVKNNEGLTPLDLARKFNNLPVLELLQSIRRSSINVSS